MDMDMDMDTENMGPIKSVLLSRLRRSLQKYS
jgi:hypothetical protein